MTLRRRTRLGITYVVTAGAVTAGMLVVATSADAAADISCSGTDTTAGRAASTVQVRTATSSRAASDGVIRAGALVPVIRRPAVWNSFGHHWRHPVWTEIGAEYTNMDGIPDDSWVKITWNGHPDWVAEGYICETNTWHDG